MISALFTNGQTRKFHFVQNKMGSPFNLIIVTTDSAKAEKLSNNCFSLIDSFSHIYSDYDSTSELSKLSIHASNGFQTCSPALWDLLILSRHAFVNSLHSFDISIGPLSSFWRSKRKKKLFPDSASVIATKEYVGLNKLHWNDSLHQILIPTRNMHLDVGGIAKGYIAQKVIDYLHQNGIDAALADAGGDISMGNAAPGNEGWLVGINVPETTDELMNRKLLLSNCSVATSGDAYQYMEHNGIKYSHIIDPRTGYGVSFQRNVTVIAKDGATADWLATACSILSINESKRICKKMHAELFISSIENEKLVIYQTIGFKRYWKK
jgi:thiamine biosynthesis lipoprotein